MKALAKTIFTIIFLIGFMCLFGESDSLGIQVAWTLGSLVLCGIGYKGLDRLRTFDDNN